MVIRELEDIDQRLRYGETVVITRDEVEALDAALADAESDYSLAQKEIEDREGDKQQCDFTIKMLRNLLDCFDDDWQIPLEDRPRFERIAKHAFAFINNVT